MKNEKLNFVNIIAAGFVVLILLSLPMFWLRWISWVVIEEISHSRSGVSIQPSGLVPDAIDNDPNIAAKQSRASAYISNEPSGLGIVDWFRAKKSPGGSDSKIYLWHEKKVYFDQESGLVVGCDANKQDVGGKERWVKKVHFYAGPNGISETKDKSLGRFIEPVSDSSIWYELSTLTIYDKKLRRFFRIDLEERTLFKGPALKKDDGRRPIQIGRLEKNKDLINLNWSPPLKDDTDEDSVKRQRRPGGRRTFHRRADGLTPIVEATGDSGEYLLVLDESGRIDLFDRETLEFAGIGGWLPAAPAFFTPEGTSGTKDFLTSKVCLSTTARTKDLLGYEVYPLTFTTDGKYRGLFVASVSRDKTGIALTVYDKDGKLVAGRQNDNPTRRAILDTPWAPTILIAKYLLENIQPAAFGIISYFTASSFDAAGGHRALFILPNSLVGMFAREAGDNIIARFMFALLIMSPSILLGAFFGWRINKDARVVGLSDQARICWTVGAIAFGLAAYITYKATAPKITLVSCENCGSRRRPDMEICHHCGCSWDLAELSAPGWRVFDKGQGN